MTGNGAMRLRTARPVAKLRQGRNDWYRIENRLTIRDEDGGGTYSAIYIYDEIGYWGITAKDFIRELQAVTDPTIELHLNTPGGDVFDGIAIYNALKSHSATVNVVVDALAASAGSFIAQAGDKVSMTRNATMMIHDAQGLAIGNAADMREMAELLDKTSDNIADIYAQRTGVMADEWRAAMKAETWYSATEAVEAGLADEVAGDTTGDDPKNTWDLSIFNFSGRDSAPAPALPAQPEPVQFDAEAFRRALKEATT